MLRPYIEVVFSIIIQGLVVVWCVVCMCVGVYHPPSHHIMSISGTVLVLVHYVHYVHTCIPQFMIESSCHHFILIIITLLLYLSSSSAKMCEDNNNIHARILLDIEL